MLSECDSYSLCDGLQLGPRRRRRGRSTVCVRCTRVVRTLTWWDETVGSCRVKSGYVGKSRVKSGEKIYMAHFCRYGFATLFSFPEPTPGTGSLATTLSQTPDSRRSAGGWGGVSCPDAKSRAKSGQCGQFTLLWSFAFCLAHVSLLS